MTNGEDRATLGPMTYAPVLAVAFLLWPLMGLLGGQGYAPLLGLVALAALVMSRPGWPPARYALLAFACVIWAAVTEIWSPASRSFISGNLLEGDFAIKSASLRVALVPLLGSVALAGALRIPGGSAARSADTALFGFALQGAVLLGTVLLAPYLLEQIYGPDPQRQNEGIQNIVRNANAFALVLPVLFAFLVTRESGLQRAGGYALLLASLAVFASIGAHAAFVGGLLMFAGFGIITLFPATGFRVLFAAMAAYILFAPLLIGAGIAMLEALNISLPGSFQSRAWSWEIVIGKIQEAPLLGHGVEASRTWKETYGEHPEWLAQLPDFWASYPVVPGHPHNMALQIWAELGFVGAALSAATLVLIGFRLPRPSAFHPDVRLAAAGVGAASVSLFSFAYSVTNDAFWSSIVLAAIAIILLAKRSPNPA